MSLLQYPQNMTFNICLINNYNNALYLKECIDSALSQSISFDQIIVVDDGSTDDSILILNFFKANFQNFTFLEKNNGGQISTLNFSRDLIPEDSQVFLLDSDDVYPLDYLENVLHAVQFKPWDFAFCEHHIFDGKKTFLLQTSQKGSKNPFFFKGTSALTRSRQCWIGNLTSTLSLSGAAFRKIYPYPIKRGETLYADDVTIFAASILGYTKIYLPSIFINWRSHDGNNSKKEYTSEQIKLRIISIQNLITFYCNKYYIDHYPSFSDILLELSDLNSEWIKKLGLPNSLKISSRLLRQKIRYFFASNT